ncbi:Fic family protein [Planctomycetota bacterium]
MSGLTYERLIKFDLVEEAEKDVLVNNRVFVVDLLQTQQDIISTDQFIRELPAFPGSTDKILRTELISAVGSTLAIEGIKLNSDEIKESFEKADSKQDLIRAEQEAENSRQAYEFVINYARNKKNTQLSEGVIKQIHKILTDKIRYQSNVLGEYRNSSVTFGNPRKVGLCKTESEVREAMSCFAQWLNLDGEGLLLSNPIVKAIAAHYYFTEIHPFGDGNGRTARTLEAMILHQTGVNQYCFWSLANFWSANRDEYISRLGQIAQTCAPLDFILWGMKGYLEEIKRIKYSVKLKVQQLMLLDYSRFLFKKLKTQATKANRCLGCLHLLTHNYSNGIRLNDFRNTVEIKTMYTSLTIRTQRRDFEFLLENGLITLESQDKVLHIKPRYEKLDGLNYNI